MSESQPLATRPEGGIVVSSDLTPEQQLALINELSEGNYVPRIELVQSNSAARHAKLADDGEYLHNGTTKFGQQFVCVPVAWRPHAIMFDDEQNVVAESFDPSSEVFKSIKAKEAGPKRAGERPGSGTDFLVWVPDHMVYGIFPLMKTARRHVKPMFQLHMLKKAALIGSAPVTAKGNTWYSPVVQEYRGTVDPAKNPSQELTEKATRLFRLGSQTQEAEAAAPADGSTERPR